MLSLTPAFVLAIVLGLGWKLRNWQITPMVIAMMLAFSLSAASPIRPAVEALNDAFASLVNSVGGGSGIV